MSLPLPIFSSDFRSIVRRAPDSIAIVDGRQGYEWTYAQLDRLIIRCGKWIQTLELKPGDTVLSLLPNSVEALVIFLTTLRYGYRFAPLPLDATANDINRLDSLVSVRLILLLSDVKEPDGLVKEGVILQHIPLDGRFDWLPIADTLQEKLSVEIRAKIYLATSGSMGEPKVMVIDGDTLWAAGRAFLSQHKFITASDRFYNIMPMSYLGGLFNLGLVPLAAGASTVVADVFSGMGALRFWPDVIRFRVTIFWLVPTMVRSLLAITAQRFSPRERGALQVKTALLGTAPIDLPTKEAFETTFGIQLLENYALSETTFLTSDTLDRCAHRKPGSVGVQLPYVEIDLVPFHGDEEMPKTFREICVRTPYLFDGYLDAEERINPSRDENGYFHTGDLGHFEDGHLVLDGRCRDVVKKGGILVVLPEIEALALRHQSVVEVAGVGVEHDFYGEDYILFVHFRDPYATYMVDDLRAFLCENLARAKWPNDIRRVAEMPLTRSGKIAKGELRKMVEAKPVA